MPNLFRTLRRCIKSSLLACLVVAMAATISAGEDTTESTSTYEIPADARLVESLGSQGSRVFVRQQSLLIVPAASALQQRSIRIPRLCAPIRSVGWIDDADVPVRCAPEPNEWIFTWTGDLGKTPILQVELDAAPTLLADAAPVEPTGDGSVMLHAYQARTYGEKLRYEPQWYKNTVGYWVDANEYATWQLRIEQPGTFTVAILQGCGAGQGGSDAQLTLRQSPQVTDSQVTAQTPTTQQPTAQLEFKTLETGHFQNFRWHHLGRVTLDNPGQYELRIEPRRIANAALLDVRAIHLVRQAN